MLLGRKRCLPAQVFTEGQEQETGPEDGDGIVPYLYNTKQAQSHPLHTVLGHQEDIP